jgi:hypothetical protein
MNGPFGRVQDASDARRLGKFSESVSSCLNALVEAGYLVQTGPASWVLANGGQVGTDPISAIYPPFTVTNQSDEFNGASFSGWTSVVPGSNEPTITQVNNTLSLLMPGGDSSGVVHAYLRAPTIATGSSVTCALRGVGPSTNYHMAGVLFTDGTTYGAGKQMMWYICPPQNDLQMATWTDFNNQVSVTTYAISGQCPYGDLFLKLVYSATNTWQGWVSADGISYVNMTGNISYTLTPTRAGFFASTFSAGTPFNWNYRFVRFQ